MSIASWPSKVTRRLSNLRRQREATDGRLLVAGGAALPLLLLASGVLLTSPLLPRPAALAVEPALRAAAGPRVEGTCGTCVKFLNNPVTAARTAGKSRKLLFVLHVSGNFEDSRFT